MSATGMCSILSAVQAAQVLRTELVDADASAVHRFRAGEEAAFEELVSRREAEVHRLALRMLGDPDEAMEATQDAFLRAYRALPRFRGDASFRTWLVGITLNVCRSRVASRATRERRRTVSLDASDPEEERGLPLPAAPGPDPERAAQSAELAAQLEHALAGLSPEHREVLLLREMEGFEYDAIASALGCAVGTVKSRLARARNALRMAMEAAWP